MAPLSRRRVPVSRGVRRQQGFTLLEVVVALAITLAALSVFYGSAGAALGVARTSPKIERAVSRAQSRLASIVDPGAMLGQRSGDDGDGFHWTTLVTVADTAPPPREVRAGIWARGTSLYAVEVRISWAERGRQRAFDLAGAVLGAPPGTRASALP